jgi:hypothetical protein
MSQFHVTLDDKFDSALLKRVEDVFHRENLLQTILHAHLLLERALNIEISQKLKRPEVLEDGTFGRWSFHQKIGLYVALYDPEEFPKQLLLAFNRLRNTLAHKLQSEEEAVAKCLPWAEGEPLPDAQTHVWAVIAMLFMHLGIVKRLERISPTSDSP